MNTNRVTRRQFLQTSAAAAGAIAFGAGALADEATAPAKRTAVDQVTLGATGIKLSRLGMGTGSASGKIQVALGKDGFTSLVHYAYDQGITYFDCARSYATYDWLGGAIKGLPREKVFIQSKIDPRNGEDMMAAIDEQRKVYNTDYVDSLLVHCQVKDDWTDRWKSMMDTFDQAKSKGWLRAKGVSCHSLPALRLATASPWVEVHLLRVNPQGRRTDGEAPEVWSNATHDIEPTIAQLKLMGQKNRGVIGMKILGNGEFLDAGDREKSIRYAMSHPEINAVVMGFKSRAEIDEAIERMNRALAA